MTITTDIIMHMDVREPMPRVDIVQGDANTRMLRLVLLSGGSAWTVPGDTRVLVRYWKPDGTYGFYDQLPDESCGWKIEGNCVILTLAPQVLTAHGAVFLDAVLMRQEQVIATFPVLLHVSGELEGTMEGESENYFSIQAVNAAYEQLKLSMKEIPDHVAQWLQEHPEVTTTVTDGSITLEKLSDPLWETVEAIPEDLYIQGNQIHLMNNGKLLGEGAILPESGTGFDALFFDEDGYLHIQENGEDVVEPVLIGTGGGGGNVSTLKLKNLSPSMTFAVAAGEQALVKFNWTSLEDGVPTGAGTVQYLVNGTLRETVSQAAQGDMEKDVSFWLTGGSNTLQVKITDSYGMVRKLSYTIQVVQLTITSGFDYTVPQTGALNFRFIASGGGEKTVHFALNGKEAGSMQVLTSGKTSSFSVPAQSHGAHLLTVWATAQADGMTLSSNVLRYSVMWVEDGNTSPMIASAFAQTGAEEGDTLQIPYVVYDPAGETAAVTLKENGAMVSQLSVGRTEQMWTVKANTAGSRTFSIHCADVSVSFPVTVTALDIDVSVSQTDKVLELSAEGRSNAEITGRDSWVSGDISAVLSGFNFRSNGWVADEAGNTVLRIDGGASVQIPYNAFATDARASGRTIELDFATRAVQASGSMVIRCLSGGVGFSVTDQSAQLKSEGKAISVRFKEEERLHIVFALESAAQDRLINVYINGILSGVTRYEAGDNLQQGSPVGITIGSNSCGVDIYTLRVYDTCLNDREVLENYLSCLPPAERKRRYLDNHILNDAGDVAYQAVMERVPVMIVTGELPSAKGEKKVVTIDYTDMKDTAKCFSYSGVTMDVQGTSSQGYPRKNYKIKLPQLYEHITGHIPEKTFTLKTDYMESSGKHNTQAANFIGSLYSEPTPPQQEDERVRTTIAGFPFALFHRATAADTPVFVGKYNFNNDKGNADTLGMTDPNLHQRWEVCNNISARCMFLDPDFTHGDITTDFEASYPDPDDKIPDYTALQSLAQWIYDTREDPARFKAEVAQHFNLHYLLTYAVVSEFLGAMDSRTKNMFLQTWDRQIWYPVFYDIDTILGLDNEGHNAFGYDMEWQDGVWNGSGNALWNSVETALADEMAETYRNLRASGKLTYEKLLQAFDGEAAHMSEMLYNEDAAYKYIGPLVESGTDYLYAAQGSRESHRKWWLYNRLKYLDAKYNAGKYKDDLITMRLYTKEDGKVPPSGDFDITMFADGYASALYGANGTQVKQRAKAGEKVTLNAPDMTFKDTETFLYGASRISSLGDLSDKYADTVDVSKAVRLKELILGSAVSGYENPNLKGLTVTNNTLLEKLDVRGCTALVTTLGLGGCSNIRCIYAQNSAITGVTLPVGGRLEEMYLPATVTGLIIRDHPTLHTLQIAGYGNLSTIRLENCGSIDSLTIVRAAENLSRLRLLGVNWEGVTAEDLNKLLTVGGMDDAGNNMPQSVITGSCFVDSCALSQMTAWKAAWPNLTVNTAGTVADYTVTFQDHDGTVLDTQTVPYKNDAVEPIAAGRVTTPVKQGDAQYSYTFSGWQGDLTNITENRIITAGFTQIINVYDVKIYNGDILLMATTAEYGSAVSYTGAFPVYNGTEEGDWIFSGWSADLTFITGTTNAYAQFEKLEVPASIMTLEAMSWPQILAVARAGSVDADGDLAIEGTKWLSVGDEKQLTLVDGITMTVLILGFHHDEKTSGGTAPITFGFKNVHGGWKGTFASYFWPTSDARTKLNEAYILDLPESIRVMMVAVNKVNRHPETSEFETTADKFFLPSKAEIGGTSVPGEGACYPVFVDDASRVRYNLSGSTVTWCQRTVYRPSPTLGLHQSYVRVNGWMDASGNPANSFTLCPAFCIG